MKLLKDNKNDIYFADFETTTPKSKQFEKEGHTNVWLWSTLNVKTKKFVIKNTLEEFEEWLFSDKKDKTIYFHNLSFDGNFICKYFWRKYPNMYCDLINEKTDDYIYCFENDNTIYQIDIVKNNIKIRFLCSYKMLSNSVEMLGKSVGFNKHNFNEEEAIEKKYGQSFYNLGGIENYKNNSDIKYVFDKYIKNDINIVLKAFKNFENDMINSNEEAKPSLYWKGLYKNDVQITNILTVTGLIQKLFKNYIFSPTSRKNHIQNNFYISSYQQYLLMRKFYSGGFVQFNPIYQKNELSNVNAISIDINSSYPFQMTKLLPYGELMEGKAPADTKYRKFLQYVVVNMDFVIKPDFVNFPCIKDLSKVGRYATVGCGIYYFLYEEFELLKKIYKIKINSIEYYYSKADDYLKEFIEKYYQRKANARTESEKMSAKILLNSFYGSFAKQAIYPSQVLIDKHEYARLKKLENPTIEFNNETYQIDSFMNKECQWLNGKFVKILPADIEAHLLKNGEIKLPNMLVGATITAYGRIQLINTILNISKAVGMENILYTDTDSIKFNAINDKWKKYVDLDNKKLGAWKIEEYFDKWKTTGAKRYLSVNSKTGDFHSATAGIKLKFEFWEEVDKLLLANNVITSARLSKKEDNYGIYLHEIDIKILPGKQ